MFYMFSLLSLYTYEVILSIEIFVFYNFSHYDYPAIIKQAKNRAICTCLCGDDENIKYMEPCTKTK